MTQGNPAPIRHDWSLSEVQALYALPFMDLHAARAAGAPRAPRAQHGADEHAAVDQDRRLPGGLRLLPAERALRHRGRGRGADAGGAGARGGRARQGRRRHALLHGRGLPLAQGARPRADRADDRARCARSVSRPAPRSACSSPQQAEALKDAGLDYYNHNLDTSSEFYGADHHARAPTRTASTRSTAVRAAGLKVCCGGIVGLGESRRRPRGAAAHARQPPRAPRERADQPAGAGPGHAARGRRQRRPVRLRAHHRRGAPHDAARPRAAVGRARGDER